MTARFTNQDVLVAPAALQRSLVHQLADLGIEGGGVYDALVGLTANAHGELLLTRDNRARRTYELIGVAHELLTA